MQIKEAIDLAVLRFKEVGINSPYIDSRLLLAYSITESLEYLLSRSDEKLSDSAFKKFLSYVERRLKLEPIAYIVGYKEFYSRKFEVNKHVLIPRTDTETLIDAVLSDPFYKSCSDDCAVQILELGVGSGCIIITLLLELQNAQAVACDISIEALSVADKNAKFHSVDNRLKLLNSHWFDNIGEHKFDLIISNPPYISKNKKDLVTQETLYYEPHLALFAEQDGLGHYVKIAKSAKQFLKKQGKLFLEIGFDQAESVTKIFISEGYVVDKIYKDLARHERIIAFTIK